MKTKLLLIACLALCPLSSAVSQDSRENKPEPKDSHTAAVEEFFLVMKMKETTDKTIDQMLTMQVAQQPQLADFKDIMTSFLRKHVSYTALKDDMVKLYRNEFTEEEMRVMTEFYRTPVGQKAVSKLPTLAAAGAQLGMSRVQANMGELQQAIQKRQQELQQQQ